MEKDNNAETRGGGAVPALRRAVQILDLLAIANQRLTATDIARHLGLPKSTAHGLIGAMVELRLLGRGADGSYRLGPHPMRWAGGFLSQTSVVSAFQEFFEHAPEWSSYTVTLTVLEEADVVYIGCRNSDKPLGHTFVLGTHLPAAFTATGKMLLSELPDGEIDTLFSDGLPPGLTPRSVRELPALKAELADIRARGFSIDDGQIREGMICLGAPIRDFTGKMVAGIAISVLRDEVTSETVPQLGRKMQLAAAALSRRLGAP